jgi:hypothetical protein
VAKSTRGWPNSRGRKQQRRRSRAAGGDLALINIELEFLVLHEHAPAGDRRIHEGLRKSERKVSVQAVGPSLVLQFLLL